MCFLVQLSEDCACRSRESFVRTCTAVNGWDSISISMLPGVCLSVCLLETSLKNYWSNFHENFTRDVSVDKEKLKFKI